MVVIISYSSNTSAPYYGGFCYRDGFFIIYFLPVGLSAWAGLCSREALKVCVIKNCARKNKFKTV